jgi:4'-phosphopantetheinyl transferase
MSTALARPLVVHCHPTAVLPVSARIEPGNLPSGTVHLWFATLDALRPRMEALRELLDPVEQERMARFRFEHDRERFVLGHGWLRELLGVYLKRDGSLVRIARGPFGKPYLERKDLRFNMSDTKDAILIGFASGLEIGVDIETMARTVDHGAVSKHYFTPAEIRVIESAGDQARKRFLEFWTRKEAVLKASGVGIMEDLRVLRVDGEVNNVMIDHEAFGRMAAPEYHVHTWSAESGHLISLAIPVRAEHVQVAEGRALMQ